MIIGFDKLITRVKYNVEKQTIIFYSTSKLNKESLKHAICDVYLKRNWLERPKNTENYIGKFKLIYTNNL